MAAVADNDEEVAGVREEAGALTRYRCTKCEKVLSIQYFMTNACDHKFCLKCKQVYVNGGKKWRCPVCDIALTDREWQSLEFPEAEKQLLLRCPNGGCDHLGPFKHLNEHVEGCAHTKKNMKKLHNATPTTPQTPPLRTQSMETMKQRMMEMEERLSSVDEKVNDFSSGLLLEITKQKEDMSRLKQKISEIRAVIKEENKDKIKELGSACQSLKEEISEKKDKNIVILTDRIEPEMTSFDLLNESDKNAPSIKSAHLVELREWFKWPGYPVLARPQPTMEGNSDVCLTLLVEYQNEDKFRANFKLLPNVYYVTRFLDGFNRPTSSCASVFYSFQNGSDLNYKHTIKQGQSKISYHGAIEVYVEPLKMARMVHSYDGNLNWTMSNFAKRKQMEREGQIEYQESPYFYTGPKGYRVRLHLYLDGVGKNKGAGLMARISFLTGAFDEDLSHEFAHRTTVTLIDGNDPEYNVVKSAEKNLVDGKSYEVELCDSKEVLYLIEDDVLIVNVTLEAV